MSCEHKVATTAYKNDNKYRCIKCSAVVAEKPTDSGYAGNGHQVSVLTLVDTASGQYKVNIWQGRRRDIESPEVMSYIRSWTRRTYRPSDWEQMKLLTDRALLTELRGRGVSVDMATHIPVS